jgi:hypothetical protein
VGLSLRRPLREEGSGELGWSIRPTLINRNDPSAAFAFRNSLCRQPCHAVVEVLSDTIAYRRYTDSVLWPTSSIAQLRDGPPQAPRSWRDMIRPDI